MKRGAAPSSKYPAISSSLYFKAIYHKIRKLCCSITSPFHNGNFKIVHYNFFKCNTFFVVTIQSLACY